ncbi:MAG: hypothetical protein FJX56_13505, partial [Alphaproteobacteria bacterium]|nr:hypothetical protein [Alphaproteobacteria bacterium]
TTNSYTFIAGSDVLERFARGSVPEDTAELAGEAVTLGLRQQSFVQGPGDVYAVCWTGGGGYGDPFERDPAQVQADLDNRAISVAAARTIYGAVLDGAGRVDPAATLAHRSEVRAARVRRKGRHAPTCHGALLIEAAEALHVRRGPDGPLWCCARCSARLGPAQDNYKDHAVREDHHIAASNPRVGDPHRFIDETVAFRQFYCPGCGGLIENEIAIESDPLLRDIALAL